MKFIEIEKIWEKFKNKYEALNHSAKEARRVIEAVEKNEITIGENPFRYALKQILMDKDQVKEKPEKGEEKK